MEDHVKKISQTTVDVQEGEEGAGGDCVWGAAEIGREIARTASQVHYLFGTGVLAGAVRKVGHRTLLGSRRKLRQLPLGPDDAA
jgi:hypothetical protein